MSNHKSTKNHPKLLLIVVAETNGIEKLLKYKYKHNITQFLDFEDNNVSPLHKLIISTSFLSISFQGMIEERVNSTNCGGSTPSLLLF